MSLWKCETAIFHVNILHFEEKKPKLVLRVRVRDPRTYFAVSNLRCIMTAVAIDNLSRGNSLIASSVETDSLYVKVVGVVVKVKGQGRSRVVKLFLSAAQGWTPREVK